MNDQRKLQNEGLVALINYSTLCAKKCDVLKGHDDTFSKEEEQCIKNFYKYNQLYYLNKETNKEHQ